MDEMMVYGGGTPAVQQGAGTEMMMSRQTQEVQAAMVIAQRFPRNVDASFARIMQNCKRKALAERAMYEYPRGGENVTGPSIRLAEMLAQNWGNIDFGIVELAQRPGESEVMSYCWDLETNTRQTKIFTVPHVRQTKKGAKALTDPRDIYEMVANQGARRLRACIPVTSWMRLCRNVTRPCAATRNPLPIVSGRWWPCSRMKWAFPWSAWSSTSAARLLHLPKIPSSACAVCIPLSRRAAPIARIISPCPQLNGWKPRRLVKAQVR